MTKTKKIRKPKSSQGKSTSKNEDQMETDQVPVPPPPQASQGASLSEGGMLSKLDVDLNALERQLMEGRNDDDDGDGAKTAITSKSFRGLNLKKKEKHRIRKDFWHKKMDLIKIIRKEAQDQKKRKQTPVVGDMKPLSDSLPTLELLLKQSKLVKQPRVEKPKGLKKEKSRHKEMMDDMNIFKMVVNHPEFKANALSTIKTHLRNKIEMESQNS